MIDWAKTSASDFELITQIIRRAAALASDTNVIVNFLGLRMDIEAAHIFAPLDLSRLLDADDGNFGHDVFGIYAHIDRDTGQLLDGFAPRYSL